MIRRLRRYLRERREWRNLRTILRRDRVILACWRGRWLP